jgi:stage V sporulation protein G
MKITEVRISIRDDEKLKAFVSITLEDCFVIRGLKIIKGHKGLFVAMPSRKRPDGTFQDLAHPINNEMRSMMEAEILSYYRQELEKTVLVE